MLMMLGGWGLKPGPAPTDVHANPASSQLMLMILEGWVLNPGQLPADAHDARGLGVSNPGQLTADAHDARGLGFQTWASFQLMLMKLGGWGFKPGPAPS